jgi:C4-dicarboxylate-specific signal transduction histidine kinase
LCNAQVYQVLDIKPSDIVLHPIQQFLHLDQPNNLPFELTSTPFPLDAIFQIIESERFHEIPMTLNHDGKSINVLVSGHKMLRQEEPDLLILLAKDAEQSRLLRELRDKQQQLVQASKLASMGELSCGIAHELNNPLFAVSGLTEVMQMRLERDFPEAYAAVAPSIENMMIATDKMRRIINHIRIFARQEQMAFTEHSINTVVQSSLLLMQEQLRMHNIGLTLMLDPTVPSIQCAPNRLEQVLINLLSNARDAIDEKKAQHSDTQGHISIETTHDSTHVTIRFRDNGTGIPHKEMDKIYDPFYSTKEVGKGTGLGLSISYSIIQEHHGSIQVRSKTNEFTEFEIKIPLT